MCDELKIVHNSILNYATGICMTGSYEKCSNNCIKFNVVTSGKATLSLVLSYAFFKERKRRHMWNYRLFFYSRDMCNIMTAFRLDVSQEETTAYVYS